MGHFSFMISEKKIYNVVTKLKERRFHMSWLTDEERYREEWENSDDCKESGIDFDEYKYNREVSDYGMDDDELGLDDD